MFFSKIKDYPEYKIENIAKVAVQQRCYIEVAEAKANADINIDKIEAEVICCWSRLWSFTEVRIL